MFELIASKITVEIFLASIPVLITWGIYRTQLIDERKRILNSMDALLKLTGPWFDAEYTERYENTQWYNPNFSVFPVDTSQIPGILTSNLLSKQTSRYLSFFIQLVSRFNYRIEVFNNFLHSAPVCFRDSCMFYEGVRELSLRKIIIKIEDQSEELKFYLEQLYSLQKSIHISIGQGKLDDDIPSLSLCFKKLRCLLQQDRQQSNSWFRGFWLVFDILLLVIPFLIVSVFLIGLVKHHVFIN